VITREEAMLWAALAASALVSVVLVARLVART
jgi:hypothetical protein